MRIGRNKGSRAEHARGSKHDQFTSYFLNYTSENHSGNQLRTEDPVLGRRETPKQVFKGVLFGGQTAALR